jgi:hypothetical protein
MKYALHWVEKRTKLRSLAVTAQNGSPDQMGKIFLPRSEKLLGDILSLSLGK